MSKMSELSLVLDELITCGENMIKAANTLKEIFSSTTEETTAAPAVKTDKPAEPVAEPPVKTYEFTDVRKAFSAKFHDGYTEQVKALITKYGASKLSDIKKEDYPALMSDLEVIGCHSTHD